GVRFVDHREAVIEFSRAGPAPARSAGSPDGREIAVAAEAVAEPRRTGDAVLAQCLLAVVPFLDHRLADRQTVLADRRAPVGAHADLREAGDVVGDVLGRLARRAVGHHVFAEADPEALVGRHLAAGQDDLQRPALADDARQPHRAAVD